MSEIKDRVVARMLELISHGYSPLRTVSEILTIHELVVVDRGAELPSNTYSQGYMFDKGYRYAQQDMAGWVREVIE